MNLSTVHKITIGTSVLGGIFYALWAGHRFTVGGSPGDGVAAGVALVASGFLARYLYRFNARPHKSNTTTEVSTTGPQTQEEAETSETE